MSAILSPPALHQASTEDTGCKGVPAAAGPRRPPSGHAGGVWEVKPGCAQEPGTSSAPGGDGSRADSRAAELFPSFTPCPALGSPPRRPLCLRQSSPAGSPCWVRSGSAGLPRRSGLAGAGTPLCVCDELLPAQSDQSLFAGGLNESTTQSIAPCGRCCSLAPCADPGGLGVGEEWSLSRRGMGAQGDVRAHPPWGWGAAWLPPSGLSREDKGGARLGHPHGAEQPTRCSREGRDAGAGGLHRPPPLVASPGGEGVNGSLQCRRTKVHYFC